LAAAKPRARKAALKKMKLAKKPEAAARKTAKPPTKKSKGKRKK
jgi:hypothetical protein